MAGMKAPLTDALHRPLHDLRISVTRAGYFFFRGR
jgi:hypothetical protein